MFRIAITLLFTLLAVCVAHADARTAMFLKGVAYGIVQECPSMQVDAEAVRRTKGITGVAQGDFYDFMDGMILTSTLLKAKEQSCESICSIRAGTCYFMKGQ